MKLYRHVDGVSAEMPGAVYAIGNFDGVHLGHRAVIGRALAIARELGAPLGVLTFEPHPRQFFDAAGAPFRLTPFRMKMHQLQLIGCDLAVVLHFDATFAKLTAEAFVGDILHAGLGARHVVSGYDFVFGRGRRGNAAMLAEAGSDLGFDVTIVAPELGRDGAAFSSTQIRALLQQGDVAGAARLLGRPWEISGRVEHGAAWGRTIGFPTANVALGDHLRPAAGIYAARAGIELADGVEWHDAVAYFGTRAAVGGEGLKLEANLFDFSGDLYGRHLTVALLDWIRPDRDFDSIDALRRQIAEDAQVARAMHRARHAMTDHD